MSRTRRFPAWPMARLIFRRQGSRRLRWGKQFFQRSILCGSHRGRILGIGGEFRRRIFFLRHQGARIPICHPGIHQHGKLGLACDKHRPVLFFRRERNPFQPQILPHGLFALMLCGKSPTRVSAIIPNSFHRFTNARSDASAKCRSTRSPWIFLKIMAFHRGIGFANDKIKE